MGPLADDQKGAPVSGVLDLRGSTVNVPEERQPFFQLAQQQRRDFGAWLPDGIGTDQGREGIAGQPVEEHSLIVDTEGRRCQAGDGSYGWSSSASSSRAL